MLVREHPDEWHHLSCRPGSRRHGDSVFLRSALMSAVDSPIAGSASHFQWSAIFAGAATAAGLSFTLHAFALGVGLSIASTAPTWRDSGFAYWMLTGLYLLFVALCSFALGGYVAGRMRAPANLDPKEMEFHDGIHGLVTWGLAIIMTAVLALGAAATGDRALAPSGGSSGAAESVAGENIIASELDELFRSERLPADISYRRAEAARILLKASSHAGVPNPDRRYLAMLASEAGNAATEDPEQKANRLIAAAAQELHRARVAAVLQAFFVAAALLVGAAMAWLAACQGGRDREHGLFPMWGSPHLQR